MNLAAFKDIVTSKTARQVLLTQKHSPKILFVAGTVGVIGATVLACRATLKVSDKLEVHENLEKVVRNANYGKDESLLNRELHKLQVKTAVEIAKLYALPVGLGLVSIGALTGSHMILDKRNGALMAAYASVDQAYKNYRKRVAGEYGDDADRKMASGDGTVSVVEKLADGKTKESKFATKGSHNGSPYAVLFDANSRLYSKEPGRNALTIQMQQSWANDKLRAQGHLFLNDVLDMLAIPRTPAGQIVGWIFDPKNPEAAGDNYVDFGVFTGDQERAQAFVDGAENSVWLDFNVDGPVWDKI